MPSHSYHTRQRQLVLDCLCRHAEEHLTVAAILDDLRAHGQSVGQATVYRYLERLKQEGLVRKRVSDTDSACYQYVAADSDCHRHYHLQCVSCGTLQHVDCPDMDALIDHMVQEHGFAVDGFQTVFYGRCRRCAEALAKSKA